MTISAIEAFENLFEPPAVIPTSGTLPRCPHGVYLAGEKEKAAYCRGCFPFGPTFATRNVILPRMSDGPLTAPALRANNHAEVHGECPDCGSRIHIATPAEFECADCGCKFPHRKARKHS